LRDLLFPHVYHYCRVHCQLRMWDMTRLFNSHDWKVRCFKLAIRRFSSMARNAHMHTRDSCIYGTTHPYVCDVTHARNTHTSHHISHITHTKRWERLPASDWNPVTIFWRIKQKGPYTKFGLNHMNPICKIIAFQMKEMLHLQTLALMGQVSKVCVSLSNSRSRSLSRSFSFSCALSLSSSLPFSLSFPLSLSLVFLPLRHTLSLAFSQ